MIEPEIVSDEIAVTPGVVGASTFMLVIIPVSLCDV